MSESGDETDTAGGAAGTQPPETTEAAADSGATDPGERPSRAAPADGSAASLDDVASRWATSAAEDLGGLLGRSVAIEPGEIRQAGRDELVFGSEPVIHARFQGRDDPTLHVHAVTPLVLAHGLAAARLGNEPLQPATAEGFTGEILDAFVESMDLCAGVLGRVLAESASLPGFEHEATAPLALPAPADAALADADYRRVRFTLSLEGLADGNLDLLFDAAQADAWFGALGGDGDDWGRPLAVVDPDPESREHAESLSEALGRPVWTLDPADYGSHSLEELAESGAIVIAWDLGGYAGIELLEALLADPRTRDLPVVMASENPTRDRVLAALRFGARSFLTRPYDVEEIGQRLRNLPG